MAKKKRKPLHNYLVLVFKSCLVFSIIAAAAFCGYIFAMNPPDDTPALPASHLDDEFLKNKKNPDDATPVSVNNPDDIINKNIFINDIDVGGLKIREAEDLLNNKLNASFKDKKITFVSGRDTYDIQFNRLYVAHDINSALQKAYDYTRGPNGKTNDENIKKLEKNEYKIVADIIFNEHVLSDALNELSGKINVPPVEPTMKRVDGQFVFTDEAYGKHINIDAAKNDATDLILNNTSGKVSLVLEDTAPKYTVEDLSKATDLLGTFSTTFTAGASARNTNISNAASKLNNVVLAPGEILSTNERFGEMTAANGYKKAATIVGNKLVDDYGGGVCQVSSTLYNSVLFSELEVVERRNHSLKVGYVNWAFDATLAGTYIDFKFKNDTEYPVTIEAYTTKNSVIVNIYGHEIHSKDRTLKFESVLISSTSPGEEIVTQDPTLPLDQRVEVIKAQTGHVYNLFKLVYENGKLIERVKINTSSYKAVRGEARIGTGPAAPIDPNAVPPEEIPASEEQVYESIPEPDAPIQALNPDEYTTQPDVTNQQDIEPPVEQPVEQPPSMPTESAEPVISDPVMP